MTTPLKPEPIAQLHKETSNRMVDRLWTQYHLQYPSQLADCDYQYRLRVAHTLLLKLYQAYSNETHRFPTKESQECLIKQVLNKYNPTIWRIVG